MRVNSTVSLKKSRRNEYKLCNGSLDSNLEVDFLSNIGGDLMNKPIGGGIKGEVSDGVRKQNYSCFLDACPMVSLQLEAKNSASFLESAPKPQARAT